MTGGPNVAEATRSRIREILAAALAETGDDRPFTDDDSLVFSGRLSSLDVVDILTTLEADLGVEVSADEFDPSRFDSVDSVVELVGSLGGAAATGPR